MLVHYVYAQIKNNNVINLMVDDNYDNAVAITKKVYGQDAGIVLANYWNCNIGDVYKDGKFYDPKTNKEREYFGSEAENIETLKSKLNELTDILISKNVITKEDLI